MPRLILSAFLFLFFMPPLSLAEYDADGPFAVSDTGEVGPFAVSDIGETGPFAIESDSGAPAGTYKAYYTADYSGDTDVEWIDDGGDTQQGTVSGATIDTWTNHGITAPNGEGAGTYGVKLDANDEYIRWAIGNIDTDEGTVAADVYMATVSAENTIFTIEYDADNRIRGRLRATGHLGIIHEGQTDAEIEEGTDAVPATTWTRCRWSWSKSEGKLSYKVGANAWQSDTVTPTSLSPAANYHYLGDGPTGGGIGDTVYIDNIVISASYQDESI